MERIDKLIASQGMLSRRQVKELLTKGAVTVDGQVVRRPEYKVDGTREQVFINGTPLLVQQFSYLMLNKPKGVVSATEDPKQKTVLDLVPPELMRKGLFPAGRLDKDTEGFVLLTNDGAFAHRMLSPKSHVPKTYHARVNRQLSQPELLQFSKGLTISGGEVCRPAEIRLLELGAQPLYEVVLTEGMYHQIKRMFAVLQSEVMALKRVKIGELSLDAELPSGGCRPLSEEEILCIISHKHVEN